MKAKLNTGQIIDLPKDETCGCQDHQGPHWLYSNELARQRNRKDCLEPALEGLKRGRLSMGEMAWIQALLIRFARLEAERLRERRVWMEWAGIVEIIREG